MNNKVTHYRQLLEIAECLSSGFDSEKVRLGLGSLLLTLLDADSYASYIWDDAGKKFSQGLSVNVDDEALKEYETYYQFHDPITHRMQKRRRAASVNEIIDQEDLIETKFYNDFLCHNELYWGISLYAYDGKENIGDIRLWRNKNKPNFDKGATQLLQMVQPLFTNFLRNARLFNSKVSLTGNNREQSAIKAVWNAERVAEKFGFTPREVEIVREVLRGKKDEGIAAELCIAYSTLRTHIKHIYVKTAVHNRSALCHKVLSQLTGFT